MSSDIPRYPSSSAPAGAPSAVPAPPQYVTFAVWGFLIVALLEVVVTVISVIAVAGSKSAVRSALLKEPRLSGRHIDVATLMVGETVAVVAVGVIATAIYVIFAILLRRGFGWARIVLLVVTVISLLGITGDYGLSAVKVGIAIVATVFVFLTRSSVWFRVTKQARLDRRYAPR